MLLLVRSIGLIAALLSFKSGAYGVMSIPFNLRRNPGSFRFWAISWPQGQQEYIAAVFLMLSFYIFLDGRAVVWLLRRGLPAADGHRCPRCSYDLTGEAAPGCSECGWGRTDSKDA